MVVSLYQRIKKQGLPALLMLLCAIIFCVGCSASSASQTGATGTGTLRVGVKSYIVNFSYYNEKSDSYFGLEIDLAEALAKEMGYADVDFVEVTQDNCEDMLNDEEIDVLIACYSVSEYREQYFDFSPVYYTDAGEVMVANSSLYSGIKDLVGKTIGVNHGSSSWYLFGTMMAEKGYISGDDDATLDASFTEVKFDVVDELFAALETGDIDAVLADGSILQTYYDADKYSILENTYSEEDYAAVTKKDSELSQPVSEAMQTLLDNGTVDALIEKWN